VNRISFDSRLYVSHGQQFCLPVRLIKFLLLHVFLAKITSSLCLRRIQCHSLSVKLPPQSLVSLSGPTWTCGAPTSVRHPTPQRECNPVNPHRPVKEQCVGAVCLALPVCAHLRTYHQQASHWPAPIIRPLSNGANAPQLACNSRSLALSDPRVTQDHNNNNNSSPNDFYSHTPLPASTHATQHSTTSRYSLKPLSTHAISFKH
jgi:hypothetical protein